MLKNCRYNKHRKPFSYRQQLTVQYNSLKSPEMLSGELKCSLFVLQVLRRLDWIFLGGYLPSLSISYVGMSKDMEKKVTTTVLYKDENFLWYGFYCNRSRHGNVMTPLSFSFIVVFLCTRSFWRNRLRKYVSDIIAFIMAKFEEILWERFRNILKRSFRIIKTVK